MSYAAEGVQSLELRCARACINHEPRCVRWQKPEPWCTIVHILWRIRTSLFGAEGRQTDHAHCSRAVRVWTLNSYQLAKFYSRFSYGGSCSTRARPFPARWWSLVPRVKARTVCDPWVGLTPNLCTTRSGGTTRTGHKPRGDVRKPMLACENPLSDLQGHPPPARTPQPRRPPANPDGTHRRRMATTRWKASGWASRRVCRPHSAVQQATACAAPHKMTVVAVVSPGART